MRPNNSLSKTGTRAAQKGSHDKILAREVADRYVVHTYLIVGDLLLLAAARVPPVTS